MHMRNGEKKILVVIGTRPEAIKMAPVILQLKKEFNVLVCITTQHREMLHSVLRLFAIKPDFDLDIMEPKQDLFTITNKILLGVKDILNQVKPDIILVHGDTTTAMVTAMAAFYLQLPVGHVEAGLRTYDIYSPFPEEFNRQVIGKIAKFHFAPTEYAQNNLLYEKITKDKIFITGNTVIDALLSIVEQTRTISFQHILNEKFPFLSENKKIILVTGHRRENFGKGFQEICYALREVARQRVNLNIVYPVHLNPNVREPVNKILTDIKNIYLIEPLDYIDFVAFMDKAYLILTDSGGVQEEAPSLGKPVLVMREITERVEAVEAGTVELIGTAKEKIIKRTLALCDYPALYNKMAYSHNPYGDGLASKRICSVLKECL